MDSNKEGVSILTPLYNGIEYLEQSAKSVINQTYNKWQLIIGINGYDINSEVEELARNIIHKLNPDDNFDISVIHFSTKGKANTMNAMIKYCKYEYIAILDVDDYWTDNKLELQVPLLKEYDVVGSRCKYFGDRDDIPPIPIGNITSVHDIFDYNPIINSSVIIHKNDALWDDVNYVKPLDLEDYSLWFKLFYLKRKFYNIDKILCYHRIHKGSAFNSTNDKNVNELKMLWFNYYNYH